MQRSHMCGSCPVQEPTFCDQLQPYRKPDGSCNNLANPQWGQAYSCERRLLPASYRDGINEPRASRSGRPLPSARLVSYMVHPEKDVPAWSVSHLGMAFGQFLDHDIAFVPTGTLPPLETFLGVQNSFNNGTESLTMPVFEDDPFYSQFGITSLPFTRSLPCCHCQMGPREQMNSRTSFIDASHIYGTNKDITNSLRAFVRGLLKYREVNGSVILPPSLDPENDRCSRPSEGKICFRTGDFRGNQNPGLMTLHSLFLKDHNRIANTLAKINPHWNDESVFQVTKRIVESRFQHIVYNEWLPVMLGPTAMTRYNLRPLRAGYTKYDSRVDPTIVNEFSSAAFRFGHSNVQGRFTLFGNKAVTNYLFREPGKTFGHDLFAIDIQRGRDHGIRPYVDYVRLCRNVTVESFEDLVRHKLMPSNIARLYSEIYEDVRDIDLFSAGLNEHPVRGASIGSTFLCVVADMFAMLKWGDRFYYEHGGQAGSFTPEQLRTIRETTLAKIICENTRVGIRVQRNVFRTPNSGEPIVNCNDLPDINLEHWATGNDYYDRRDKV
ncbi:chorion peroxidase-like [Rhipicephalus sanguineus]|uniref:chorion peroxidase-like n=1 Tax=Rhipicephalus sanguineus TaxID=34632 RepID=UPI0018945537|nr:chorion peroxidase-like [Rhipicephalus sanguineus]